MRFRFPGCAYVEVCACTAIRISPVSWIESVLTLQILVICAESKKKKTDYSRNPASTVKLFQLRWHVGDGSHRKWQPWTWNGSPPLESSAKTLNTDFKDSYPENETIAQVIGLDPLCNWGRPRRAGNRLIRIQSLNWHLLSTFEKISRFVFLFI
jgi:hypothetical protein